jgi:hypothetical protein
MELVDKFSLVVTFTKDFLSKIRKMGMGDSFGAMELIIWVIGKTIKEMETVASTTLAERSKMECGLMEKYSKQKSKEMKILSNQTQNLRIIIVISILFF